MEKNIMFQRPKLSIIIPCRNEFPNIVHTVHSILNSLETDNFKPEDFEIIILDNCSDDRKEPQRGTGGSIDYLRTRGMYWNRVVRTMYYPLAGNHTVRNRGIEMARGEYVFMSDAHMAYCPHYFSEFIRTCDESGGIVHGVLDWMGAYPPSKGGLGYTIKLGEEIKGTWNNYWLTDKDKKPVQDWWYTPALGHCSLGMKRDQFLKFGGYQEHHRTYGGGEFYLNMKWWMFGSCCVINPKMIGYHLSAGRGYTYHHDDYKYNVMSIGLALGADDWVERTYINYLRKGRKEILDRYLADAVKNSAKDKIFVKENSIMTFNEMLVNRPWEQKNIERWGNGMTHLQIFHDTWLDIINDKKTPQYVRDVYKNSKHQANLDKFINEKLGDFVYKRKK